MSAHISDEPKIQDIIDAVRGPYRCRIPQRLHSERQSVPQHRNKVNNADVMFRTKSTGRTAVDDHAPAQIHNTARSIRSCREKNTPSLKKQPAAVKRASTDNNHKNKVGRPIITVPVNQKTIKTLYSAKNNKMLPDQETINHYEEMVIQECSQSNDAFEYVDLSDSDEIKLEQEKIGDGSSKQQMKNDEFKNIKIELKKKIITAGQTIDGPSNDMYVTTPVNKPTDKLGTICAKSKLQECNDNISSKSNESAIDVKKIYKSPTKIVAMCERALNKRQEIIDWLDSLKTKVSNNTLSKKITEFNSENEMLRSTFLGVKNDFFKELKGIENYIRQGVNDAVAMHLQTENMTCKLSELNTQNADLRKRLTSAESCKTSFIKNRITELEKELKDKQKSTRTRLSKAEGQIKIATERAAHLGSTLERVNTELESKEATIKQLQEQNQVLQRKYDEELKRINEAVSENTNNLEKITRDRYNLQVEKDELEKQLAELSNYYKESLSNNALELKTHVARLEEIAAKYNQEVEEKNKLKSHYCQQLLESEIQSKELEKKVKHMENEMKNAMGFEKECKSIKAELERIYLENKNFKNLILQQDDTIKKIEQCLKQSNAENQTLGQDREKQQKYILELKSQEQFIRTQLQDNEKKIKSYEQQLMELKVNVAQMKEQIRDLDDIKCLQDTIAKQTADLAESNLHNSQLSESLETKQIEVIELLETNKQKEHSLREKDNVIKSLSNVEEEQANIIRQLRNDLENRVNADVEINRKFKRKNFEINTLSNNLDIRNEQILQLEKIILTLEDKVSSQRKKFEETVHLLEMKIKIYETQYCKKGVEGTSRNLDQFLKLLEDELGNPIESNDGNNNYCTNNKNILDERFHAYKCYERTLQNCSKHKLVDLGSTLRKRDISFTSNEDICKDNNREQNKSTIDDSPSYVSNEGPNPVHRHKPNEAISCERITAKNFPLITLKKYQIEKKCKMFALAGHRL